MREELIKKHLKTHKKGITPWEAIQLYHETRLSARIFDLREKGWDIKTILEPNADNRGNHARYVLVKAGV